ncbi:hybrid sensor histidine kinase/response regulator transcription factor [Zobellia sp. 1_MG-2023]|uniref:hybrid sensor histidine kinase/response regulator n=1 Tax=Zobellia sp. 1_MG-2023 TaxID=3062626 RepID=UPI0026E295CF|nr:hybrid sensor histidine kinase/response regulator transcription factor [Zobellia sp. 1_MG-2023]MDO6819445.1 two-component regulator propeller domain-containing protein [Zobellia sp. 1_MG-2023]
MKFVKVILVLIFCAFFAQDCLYAQNSETEYNFVNIEQDNTQRAVSTIVEDSMGLIWIGTNGVGLKKYNGIDFITYKQDINEPKSISNSLIHTSYIDRSDRLWVGTETGLDLYNTDLDNFDKVELGNDTARQGSILIRAIQEGINGELLVGSHYHGVFRVDPLTMKSESIPIQSTIDIATLQVNYILKSTTGKIYVATNYGLFEYDGVKVIPSQIVNEKGEEVKSLSRNIETLFQDKEGAIWLGTLSDGLVKIKFISGNKYRIDSFEITPERVFSIAQAADGNIICGTENDGLFVLKADGTLIKNYRYDKFDVNSIKSNSIWSVFVDSQERIWIGYYNKGVGVYDKLYDKFRDIKSLANINNSLLLPSVTGIVSDKKGKLWIGLDGGGIDVYDTKHNSIVHLKDPQNGIATNLHAAAVSGMFFDSKGNLWVGTWNSGIYFLEKNATAFKNYKISNTNGGLTSNRIMTFDEDKNGIIWIGSYVTGLHSYNPKTQKFSPHVDQIFQDQVPHHGEVRKVLVDSNGFIWLGTTGGLYKIKSDFSEGDKAISLVERMHADTSQQLIVDRIISLYEDSNRIIWIGTDGGGLCKYDPFKDSFTWYGDRNGLSQQTIASILEDNNGAIWLGGNNGISRMDVEKENFKNFDVHDGLLANDFNFNSTFKDEAGILYFGSYEGVNSIDPQNLNFNEHEPEVYFTDFKLFNKSVVPGTEDSPLEKVINRTKAMTLSHDQSVFTIEYAGINFTRPKKNQYAYILEGFDNRWNYVGSTRSATYTNLPAGDYVFKVKAANNDGVWNNTPTAMVITVLAPWWSTNLAIFLYVLAILLITYFLVNLASQRIREKRIVQFEREKRLQEEVLNDRKIQFFTNISHEFRTPLTLILNPLEDILRDSEEVFSKKMKEKLSIIHKNTNRLKRLIDELMDFRKLDINKLNVKVSELEAVSFVKEITGHFEEEATLKDVHLVVESDEPPITLWSDPSMLEKVIFNILSNAFKITPDKGTITVGIYKRADKIILPLLNEEEPVQALEIYIEDTGSGIGKDELEKVFERFYQVEKMNSQYYGGTGIGLEVVKSFVDLLKGKITVESEEGIGTKFKIFLPLGNAHFKPSELFLKPTPKADGLPLARVDEDIVERLTNKGSGITLLIVEDNAELRSYLKNELKEEYTVIEAVNGTEGLKAAEKRTPDIILSDVVMPEMDGFEFCRHIREDLKTSHIPILMLTAKTMTEDWVKGIDSGADIYLTKPFEMTVLKAQLKQILSSRQVLFNKYLNDSNNVKVPENTSELDKGFISKVLDYVTANLSDENLNVEQLAEELNLSRSQLYRKIKALTGYSANEFLRKIRLEKAKKMIENGNESISEVCFKVGFSSPSYFTKCFKAQFGFLPTEVK